MRGAKFYPFGKKKMSKKSALRDQKPSLGGDDPLVAGKRKKLWGHDESPATGGTLSKTGKKKKGLRWPKHYERLQNQKGCNRNNRGKKPERSITHWVSTRLELGWNRGSHKKTFAEEKSSRLGKKAQKLQKGKKRGDTPILKKKKKGEWGPRQGSPANENSQGPSSKTTVPKAEGEGGTCNSKAT